MSRRRLGVLAAGVGHVAPAWTVLAGDRLPPARDLAAVLGVNPNTVLRALRTLREQGLVEFRRPAPPRRPAGAEEFAKDVAGFAKPRARGECVGSPA